MSSRWAVLAVVSTAFALGSAGCAGSTDTPQTGGDRIVQAQAYAVDSSPDSALRFFDNAYVFEGTVIAVQPDRRVADTLPGGQTIEAVYTPVTVVVQRGYLGGLAVGAKVTLRSMGGEADGLRYTIGEAPAKETFALGNRLVIFGGERSTLDLEPGPAVTPHFVYRPVGDTFVDATYSETPDSARTRIPAAELRRKLEKLNASGR